MYTFATFGISPREYASLSASDVEILMVVHSAVQRKKEAEMRRAESRAKAK